MSSYRPKNSSRVSPEAERLVSDALSLAASGSRVEDDFWEKKLSERLLRLLHAQNQNAIESALDQTLKINPIAFDCLAENAETLAETLVIEHDGQIWDVVLIAIPIIARTRYNIPSGKLSSESITATGNFLHEQIVSQTARIALVPWLYSIDQMPHSHCQTRQLLEKLATAAVNAHDIKLELRDMPETIPVLADPRYIVGAVAAPSKGPIFRWQEDTSRRQERGICLQNWQLGMQETVASIMPGCEFELSLPEAYFTNCREADRRIRPLSILAAVNYLEATLNVLPTGLSCIVAGFGTEQCDEYRISFALKGSKEVIYGVVWPLYDRETVANDDINDTSDDGPAREIYDTIKASGIDDQFRHAELFNPEACEDCGAPMFVDRIGEIVHPEMPEDTPDQQPLFH